MMQKLALISTLALISACTGDETLTAYGVSGSYRLDTLDGRPGPNALLAFPEPGKIEGKAPCNLYSGTQTAPYPWFNADDIISTRAACPELADESRYLQALGAMTEAEALGTTLILRNQEGREMVFSQINDTKR